MNSLKLRKSLEEAWNIFAATGKINSSIRPIIAESWQRCYAKRLSPYHNKILKKHLSEEEVKEHSDLLAIAVPIMKSLYNLVKGSSFFISLANSKGIYVAIEGDTEVIDNTRVRLGDNWTEESAGTNSIGLCLLSRKPTQVFTAEHFCKTAHEWAASSAPIFDEDDNLLGVLTMVGNYDKVHPHTLGMVVAAANAIENSLQIQKSYQKIAVSDAFKSAMMESISDGILALKTDRTIMHINKSARQLLNIAKPENETLSQPLFTFLGKNHFLCKSIDNCFASEINSTFETGEYNANLELIYSTKNEIIGLLLVLKEMKKLKKFVNRFVGARATYTFEDLIGQSTLFLSTVRLAKIASGSISNVLLLGESGTGKELFAHAIHNASDRRNNPFLAVNCAAIPRSLIESELFGYADGAFTGAKKGGNPGKFELADGGTLFLDEIGEMPLEFQVVLLRVLQEKSITRIGGGKLIPVDVRIIAATNKKLEEEIKTGNFREDLYYRLNVLSIAIPPLRERPNDIVILTEHFLNKLNQRLNKNISQISQGALDSLVSYHWPGNARELQNILERTINTATGNIILAADLPVSFHSTAGKKEPATLVPLEHYEKELIASLLNENKGNKTKVAKILGISRTTLYRKINEYKIDAS